MPNVGAVDSLLAHCTGVTRHIQYNVPGCDNTVMPGQQCGALGSATKACCPIGFECKPSAQAPGNLTCAESKPTYAYAPSSCTLRVPNGLQCGELSPYLFAVPVPCMRRPRSAQACMHALRRSFGAGGKPHNC